MKLFAGPVNGIVRKLRLRRYRDTRAALETMTEADLADIGVKRFQLGAIARRKAFD